METKTVKYINVNGKLMDLSHPQVMGILNVTPDSFYAGSRQQTEKDIINRTSQIIEEGASIIDIGAYSSRGTPQNMQMNPHYDNLLKEVFLYFSEKVQKLRDLGVKDIILDPGFGFGKTVEHNYQLMNHLEEFSLFELPLLVGISRKSMIYKLLGGTPDDALNGTTVLDTISLLKGADILRVHDVKAAVETVKIVQKMKDSAAF